MNSPLRAILAVAAATAVLSVSAVAEAHYPKILADTYCGDDGNAYAAWDVTSYDPWGEWGENPDIRIEISVDEGPWIEVGTGELFPPEWGFAGETVLPDGSITFRARAYAAAPWGDGYYTELPRYADLSWTDVNYATVFEVPTDCAPVEGPGTGTPGYWKNHPDAWPGGIIIGGAYYSVDEGIDLLSTPTAGDVTITMTRALIAAVLNVEIGNDASCIAGVIDDAQDWLFMYPPGSKVKARSDAWQQGGEAIATTLDLYNNGELCAAHRD